jgi:hypothetical protein
VTDNVLARKLYALLNHPVIRDGVLFGAAARYGYDPSQAHLRFNVGRCAGPTKGDDEKRIRAWCNEQIAGAERIEVYGVTDVVERVMKAAVKK